MMKFDWQKPTALVIGRFQPPHAGHLALIDEALKRTGQVCVAVRDTEGIDIGNPFSFDAIHAKLLVLLKGRSGVTIIKIPNIVTACYGRDVGYKIERIDLPPEIEAISATKARSGLA